MKALTYISEVEWVCPNTTCGETNYTDVNEIDEDIATCKNCSEKVTLKLQV